MNTESSQISPTPRNGQTNPDENNHEDSKEKNILNTEETSLQGNSLQISQFFSVADEFEAALKKLNFKDNNQDICKRLQKIQNKIHQKISHLKKCTKNKITHSGSGDVTDSETRLKAFISCCSLESKENLPLNTRESMQSINSNDSECLRTKLSGSLLSVVKTESVDSDDSDIDLKFQKFMKNVNCPFCLKTEDDKNYLIKHLDDACVALKEKNFPPNQAKIPYSVFQILSDNTFKCNICPISSRCNLKNYFIHSQSRKHLETYKRVSLSKNYSDFLYCVSCNAQIRNNATEIEFHIKHIVHQSASRNFLNSNYLRKKKIHFVYRKDNDFKCLICPIKYFISGGFENVLKHIKSEVHSKQLNLEKSPFLHRSNQFIVFCSFCSVEVREMRKHLTETSHIRREEKERIERNLQLCFYCGFKCTSLIELALHMESQCDTIYSIRKNNLQNSGKSGNVLKETPKGVNTEKKTEKKGSRKIIVQGCDNVPDLFSYFNKIGEITGMEETDKNGILITFREEKTVNDIFVMRKLITINGVKVNIIAEDFEDSESAKKSVKDSSAKLNTDIKVFPGTGGDENSFSRSRTPPGNDLDDSSSSTVSSKLFSFDAANCKIPEDLFERVSIHLKKTAVKFDPKEIENIVNDCQRVLKIGKLHHVGFSKLELTFSVEGITFYCQIDNSLLTEKSAFNSTCVTELELFNKFLVQKCETLLAESSLFDEVKVPSDSFFPSIKFFHVNTKKYCRIIFRETSKLLTNMLRDCLAQNELVGPFVLLVRFWLSVHKLKIREFEYALSSLLVFFLVTQKEVNCVHFKQSERHLLVERELSSKGLPTVDKINVLQSSTVGIMFEKFLRFISNFDFKKNAICLPLTVPVPKDVLLKKHIRELLSDTGLEQNAVPPLWITDPFLYNNLASKVEEQDLDSFLKVVREITQHYEID